MITLSPGDYITIAQTAIALVHPYNSMSKHAKIKVQLAEELKEEIIYANNKRDILNRMLDYFIEAHKQQVKSIFLWPLWDGDYVSSATQDKFTEVNRICVSIANTYYEIGELDLAKIWLRKMDYRGDYERTSIPIFRKILGIEYDNFKESFMDSSERYIKGREEVREELRNRHLFY